MTGRGPAITAHGSLDLKQEIQIQMTGLDITSLNISSLDII
jgi:hypothetical protein